MELLNNFIGEVSSISINDIIDEISKNDLVEPQTIIEKLEKKNITGTIFNDKLLEINKEKVLNIDLSEIKYFGGLDSFIPLIKLINYIIILLDQISKNNQNNINGTEGNQNFINNYLQKSIIWIKDIIRIIIKMICLSGNNYKNFLQIIVPLIGGFAETFHSLKNISIISNNYIDTLFDDEAFFILYIIILNTNIQNNIKITFKKLFGMNFDNNKNFTMNSIIFDIKKYEIKDLDFYITLLFNIIFYIKIYYDSNENNINLLIDHLIRLKKELNEKKNDNYKEMVKAMEPIIFFLQNNESKEIFQQFSIFYRKLNNNKFYPKYIMNIIKTFLNAKQELKYNEIDSSKLNFFNRVENIINFHAFNPIKEEKNKIIITNIKNSLIISRFKYYYDNINFIHY